MFRITSENDISKIRNHLLTTVLIINLVFTYYGMMKIQIFNFAILFILIAVITYFGNRQIKKIKNTNKKRIDIASVLSFLTGIIFLVIWYFNLL